MLDLTVTFDDMRKAPDKVDLVQMAVERVNGSKDWFFRRVFPKILWEFSYDKSNFWMTRRKDGSFSKYYMLIYSEAMRQLGYRFSDKELMGKDLFRAYHRNTWWWFRNYENHDKGGV